MAYHRRRQRSDLLLRPKRHDKLCERHRGVLNHQSVKHRRAKSQLKQKRAKNPRVVNVRAAMIHVREVEVVHRGSAAKNDPRAGVAKNGLRAKAMKSVRVESETKSGLRGSATRRDLRASVKSGPRGVGARDRDVVKGAAKFVVHDRKVNRRAANARSDPGVTQTPRGTRILSVKNGQFARIIHPAGTPGRNGQGGRSGQNQCAKSRQSLRL